MDLFQEEKKKSLVVEERMDFGQECLSHTPLSLLGPPGPALSMNSLPFLAFLFHLIGSHFLAVAMLCWPPNLQCIVCCQNNEELNLC